MLERKVEAHLVKVVKAFDGEIRKVKWIGRRGAPDRRVMLPGLCFWCELKRPGKELSPHQEREIKRMRAQGEKVHVFSSIEQIDRFFESRSWK